MSVPGAGLTLPTGVAQLVEHRSPKPSVESSSLSTRAKSKGTMFKNFFHNCKESYNELVHKTTWPSGKELTSSAVIVLVASLMIAIVVYLMDECFQVIMTNIIYP